MCQRRVARWAATMARSNQLNRGRPANERLFLIHISHKSCSRRGKEADWLRSEEHPPHHFGGYTLLCLYLIGEKCGLILVVGYPAADAVVPDFRRTSLDKIATFL
jgi:hypothetical protein